MIGLDQLLNRDAADVSGAAGDEDLHILNPFLHT